MKLLTSLGFVAFFAASSVANASPYELLVTSAKDKNARGGETFAIDAISDGSATALEIRIDMGLSKDAKVNTSRCAASLPASHQGSCVFNGKEVVVLVYSTTNALLPKGNIDLGTIQFNDTRGSKKQHPVVTSFIAGTPAGLAVSSSVHSDFVN